MWKAAQSQFFRVLCLFSFIGFSITLSAQASRVAIKSIGNLTMPMFRDGEPLPYAIIRAESIRSDYQRRGFFKIGILHMVVADNFEIELARPEDFLPAMETLPSILPEIPKGALMIHNLSVRVRGENSPLIKAQELIPSRGRDVFTIWRVSLSGDTNEIKSAQLWVHGSSAGEIQTDTGRILYPFKSTHASFQP